MKKRKKVRRINLRNKFRIKHKGVLLLQGFLKERRQKTERNHVSREYYKKSISQTCSIQMYVLRGHTQQPASQLDPSHTSEKAQPVNTLQENQKLIPTPQRVFRMAHKSSVIYILYPRRHWKQAFKILRACYFILEFYT